jgi:hypothetical protein
MHPDVLGTAVSFTTCWFELWSPTTLTCICGVMMSFVSSRYSADRFLQNAGSPRASKHGSPHILGRAHGTHALRHGTCPGDDSLPAGHSAGNISAATGKESDGQQQRQVASPPCPASPAASTAWHTRPESRLSHDVSAYAAPAAVSASGVDHSGEDRGASGSQERGGVPQPRQDSLSGVFRTHHEPEPQPAACTVPLQPPPENLQLPQKRRGSIPDWAPGSKDGDAGGHNGQHQDDRVPRCWSGIRGAQSDGEVQGLPAEEFRGDGGIGTAEDGCGGGGGGGDGNGRADAIIGDGISVVKESAMEVRQWLDPEEMRQADVRDRRMSKGESINSRGERGQGGGCTAMRADAVIRVGFGDEGEEEVQAAASSPKCMMHMCGGGRSSMQGDALIATGAVLAHQGSTGPVAMGAAVSATELPAAPWRLRSCNGSVCGGTDGCAAAVGAGMWRALKRNSRDAHCRSGAREAGLVPRASESGSQNGAQLETRDSESEACHGSAGQPPDSAAGQEGVGEAAGGYGCRYEGEGEGSLAERNARGSCGFIDCAEWPHTTELTDEARAAGFAAMRSASSAGAPLMAAAAAAVSAQRSSSMCEGVGEFRGPIDDGTGGCGSPAAEPASIIGQLLNQSRNLNTRSRVGSVELPAPSSSLAKEAHTTVPLLNGQPAVFVDRMPPPTSTAHQALLHAAEAAIPWSINPATSGSSPKFATAPLILAPTAAGIGINVAVSAAQGSLSANAFLAATGGFAPHQAMDGRPSFISHRTGGIADMQQLPPGTLPWLQVCLLAPSSLPAVDPSGYLNQLSTVRHRT